MLFAIRGSSGRCSGGTNPALASALGYTTLHNRLPADLRDARGTGLRPVHFGLPTHDEWAAEMANRTVHGVMHIGWVPDDAGGYRGQMAVLVKPNGAVRRGLYGRDRAVPPLDRVPSADADDRAAMAVGDKRTCRVPASATALKLLDRVDY